MREIWRLKKKKTEREEKAKQLIKISKTQIKSKVTSKTGENKWQRCLKQKNQKSTVKYNLKFVGERSSDWSWLKYVSGLSDERFHLEFCCIYSEKDEERYQDWKCLRSIRLNQKVKEKADNITKE